MLPETLRHQGPGSPPATRPGHTVVQAALIGLATVACLATVMAFVRGPCRDGHTQQQGGGPVKPSKQLLNKFRLFEGWDPPSLVLMLSGEMHGYLQPCGCSSPQLGGLTRRYNLLEMLKEQGWPVVALDLGDLPQDKGLQAQVLLKYEYAMRALDAMDYTAVSIGEYEMRWFLTNIIGQYALNNPSPRMLAANIVNDDFKDTIFGWELEPWRRPGAGPKVGVVSLIGPTVEKKIKKANLPLPKIDGPNTSAILKKALLDMQARGAQLNVLLYQGSNTEAQNVVKFCRDERKKNPAFPALDVILCLSDGDAAPQVPAMVDGETTMIINVGHKGRHVGVVGAFRNSSGNPPFKLRYQLVRIEPEFETPPGKEKGHKLMALMQDYAKQVKDEGFLAKYPRKKHPVQDAWPDATYVGSGDCKNCHAGAFKIWQDSAHSHAYKTLVAKAKNPSLRQFDGECIVCHTVGFDYKTGFRDLEKTAFLIDVGCESCHGPCSEHTANHKDMAVRKAINPLGYHGEGPEKEVAKRSRLLKINDFCRKCHDDDNDVHWDVDKAWPKIIHMNPAKK
jgi:hypothetical protein